MACFGFAFQNALTFVRAQLLDAILRNRRADYFMIFLRIRGSKKRRGFGQIPSLRYGEV